MAGIALTRPPMVVGTVGFLLVTVGLLGSVVASTVVFSFLLTMHEVVEANAPPAAPQIDDNWLPWIAAMRCGFAVIILGTVASLFGLRREPQKLARWGAVVGLIVVVLAMSIWVWCS